MKLLFTIQTLLFSPYCHSFTVPRSSTTNIIRSKTITRDVLQKHNNQGNADQVENDSNSFFTKDEISSAAKMTKDPSIPRRDVLFSTATATASSFLFLQPSPSIAQDILPPPPSSSSTQATSIQFNPNSKPFPLSSFGLQIYDNETAYKLTLTALQLGYRNFFASVLAGNQKGFATAIRDSNIPRSELYICGTVLSNRAVGYKAAYAKTYKGCQENIAIMNSNSNGIIDTLDMIMLDYPALEEESVVGQWDAFLEFQNGDKVVNDLAVSNFNGRQLDYILNHLDSANDATSTTTTTTSTTLNPKPVVNQLPFSIANHPKQYIIENTKRNIHIQSWSPLSTTIPKYKDQLSSIGKKYNKSAAQIGLRWIVQRGASYCVQSKKASHFKEDLDVFDFELSDADMEVLDNLEPPRLLG